LDRIFCWFDADIASTMWERKFHAIMCACVRTCLCVCIYRCRERERESDRESERETTREIYIHLYICTCCTNNLAFADSYLRNELRVLRPEHTHTQTQTQIDRKTRREKLCAHKRAREREKETKRERQGARERERESAQERAKKRARKTERNGGRHSARARASARGKKMHRRQISVKAFIFFSKFSCTTHFEHAQIDGGKNTARRTYTTLHKLPGPSSQPDA